MIILFFIQITLKITNKINGWQLFNNLSRIFSIIDKKTSFNAFLDVESNFVKTYPEQAR